MSEELSIFQRAFRVIKRVLGFVKRALIIVLKVAVVLGGVAGFTYTGFYLGQEVGYVNGFRRALPIGACYGIKNTLLTLGVPTTIECTPIPAHLQPQSPDDNEE